MTEYKYAGFMSYSHTDEAVAARVHHALETFKIPHDLSPNVEKKLHPIFRDTTELTAHHSLSEKIQDAVNSSKFLIVLCSPAAKLSHWVNEEIRLFRSLHGEASILCVLIEGTPETSFPPSLIEGGREPLAANLGTSRESFRLGVTQLAASMLGVGLDTLIQRDNRRRRRRMQSVTAAAAVFSIIMATTALTAVTARNSAEISRTEAEKMVEFMLTDLKQDLEPVGKLDILDDVGSRVTEYYDAIPIPDMDDDRLARQARARHLLGQVALDQRKIKKAKTEIESAYEATAEVLHRNPDDTEAIFAHAQSAYWVGELANISQEYSSTHKYWEEYSILGQQLHKMAPTNIAWMKESAWGQNNLGYVLGKSKQHAQSLKHYESAISMFSDIIEVNPEDTSLAIEKANILAGKAIQLTKLGRGVEASNSSSEGLLILERAYEKDPSNFFILEDMLLANLAHVTLMSELNEKCLASRLDTTFLKYQNFLNNDLSQQLNVQRLISYLTEIARICDDEKSRSSMKSLINYLKKADFQFDINSNEQFVHLKDILEVD